VTVDHLPTYPLHEVLDVKHRRVDQAENVVKEKKRLLEVEKEKLKQREAERDKVKQHYRDKVDQLRKELDGGTTSDKIDQCKLYLKVVLERLAIEEKKVKDQQNQVELAEKNLEAAKIQLKEREKERDKILTHKKEWTKETIKELQILETRAEDDIGSTMFLTRMVRRKQEEAHHRPEERSSNE
jgi:flagellar biosynthesis chaperone FliJ